MDSPVTQPSGYILAISGSVRPDSVNSAILHALERMAPENMRFRYCSYLHTIPHFDPGIASGESPDTVRRFREDLSGAAAVIICTPEYAFGVPGTLKNALDWTVSSGSLNEKPVLALSASPLPTGGDKALASLLQTLTALGAAMDDASSMSIGAVYQSFPDRRQLTDEALTAKLRHMVLHLAARLQPGEKNTV